MARRAVSPVIRLSRIVRDLDVETPDLAAFAEDHVTAGIDSEIHTLIQALNNLMARVDRFVERERTFTREASHELRSPLTVIRMASDTLLNRRSLDTGSRDMVEKIQRSAQDMEELTEALLVLARDHAQGVADEQVLINDVIENSYSIENRVDMYFYNPYIEMNTQDIWPEVEVTTTADNKTTRTLWLELDKDPEYAIANSDGIYWNGITYYFDQNSS